MKATGRSVNSVCNSSKAFFDYESLLDRIEIDDAKGIAEQVLFIGCKSHDPFTILRRQIYFRQNTARKISRPDSRP